jgi:adenine deaminase
LLQTGDPADMVVVNSLESFEVLSVYVDGILVACEGRSLIDPVAEEPLNHFSAEPVTPADLVVTARPSDMQVIRAFDGQLFTGSVLMSPLVRNGTVISDTARDILKLVVVNRYHPAPPAAAFITGFGLKRGAIASCVAHDSHNIVAVGTDDVSIARAINLVIEGRGGIALVDGEKEMTLPLPFAGIMSGADGGEVALRYGTLDRRVKEMGTSLRSPYMTLSFMALLVIPEMKLSDRGLFDGTTFSFIPLFPNSF